MGLLLVPYTNAMRLGQGFNSYTQQICVDDAVVVNPDRAENVLLNDGTTMRILAQTQSKPSAWTRQRELIVDEHAAEAARLARESLPALKDHKANDQNHDTAETNGEPPEPTQDETILVENDNQDEALTSTVDGEDAIDTPLEAYKTPLEDYNGEPEPAPEAEVSESSPAATKSEVPAAVAPAEHKADGPNSTAAKTLTQRSGKSRQRSASVGPVRNGVRDVAPGKEATKPPIKEQAPVTGKDAAKTPAEGLTLTPTTRPKSAGWRKLQQDAAARQAATKLDDEDLAETRKAEKEMLQARRAQQLEIEREEHAEDRKRRQDNREERRRIREDKLKFERERRQETYKAIKDAAAKFKDAMTMDQMKAIVQQNQFVERFNGMGENEPDIVFDASAPRGPGQTVTYTSRFIDRLSDITDDMCISGSLSIKAAKIGGSGRGSFIDSDKFKESDLNFYISVKVTNQTVNFKDALEYNPMPGLSKDNFAKVYGDSFISGFLEGGEFNAVVSMKILNKAKKTDIQAEAKVAFTAGPVSIEAEANVGIARENIETNTETTIQVSWCGGGHIKPMEQQWDIKSLMQAAARFPDLVADCPRRTYAVLTKYENLRSFVARQPKAYSKLAYENAQIYTNVLMDAFMSYKALYKQLSDQIFEVRHKTMEILPWDTKDAADNAAKAASIAAATAGAPMAGRATATAAATAAAASPTLAAPDRALTGPEKPKPARTGKVNGFYPYVDNDERFKATIGGLDEARRAIRRQMARIVNEVDIIEGSPAVATDEDHEEPFQPPASFEMRLPKVDIPERLRPQVNPLTGQRIMAVTQTEEERKKEAKRFEELGHAPALYPASEKNIEKEEADVFAKCIELDPRIGCHFNVTAAAGSPKEGILFNNLDFLREDWQVKNIVVLLSAGIVRSVTVEYQNGLIVKKGRVQTQPYPSARFVELGSFTPGERVTSGSIEIGTWVGSDAKPNVLGVRLFTNYGRSLLAEARYSMPTAEGNIKKDGFDYKDVEMRHFDCPLSQGTLKGFFGRTIDDSYTGPGRFFRLGFIWGDVLPPQPANVPVGLAVSGRKPVPSRSGQTTGPKLAWVNDAVVATHTGRFGLTYPSPPKLLYAFSEVRGSEPTGAARPLSWNHEPKTNYVSADRFSLQTPLPGTIDGNKIASFWLTLPAYSWLTLPENEVNFNSGIFDFHSVIKSDEDNAKATYQVVFTKPYKTVPAPPAVWCVTMNYMGCLAKTKDTVVPLDGRLRHSISDLTATGFKLSIETWNNARHAGNVWGWCTWDKEYDGVKVKAESKVVCCGNSNGTPAASPIRGALELWEPAFPGGKQPASILTGINGYDIDITEDRRMHLRSQWQGMLENGGVSCGVDGSGRARYVSAMYLAILED